MKVLNRHYDKKSRRELTPLASGRPKPLVPSRAGQTPKKISRYCVGIVKDYILNFFLFSEEEKREIIQSFAEAFVLGDGDRG